ncbi:MAG: FUN14 domain-containing protein [Aquificaceae bacterium]
MNWGDLLLDMGYAGFAGFVVGFAVRRILNFFLLLLGLYLLSLMWLSSKGIISVNWDQLFLLFKGMFEGFTAFVHGLIRKLAFAGSFAVGFAIGFKA